MNLVSYYSDAYEADFLPGQILFLELSKPINHPNQGEVHIRRLIPYDPSLIYHSLSLGYASRSPKGEKPLLFKQTYFRNSTTPSHSKEGSSIPSPSGEGQTVTPINHSNQGEVPHPSLVSFTHCYQKINKNVVHYGK